MSRIPTHRTRTRHLRRGTKRNHNRDRQIMHLSHAQVGCMSAIQHRCYFEGSNALIHVFIITQLLLAYTYTIDNDGGNMTEPLIMALLHISIAKLRRLVSNFNLCQYLDYVLHGIPPEEDEATIIFKPHQNVVFESWSDWPKP